MLDGEFIRGYKTGKFKKEFSKIILEMRELAELIKRYNEIGKSISKEIGRPAIIGHVGEYIAYKVFEIELEQSGSKKAIDGHFHSGPLKGKSVNIKWYAKQERHIDIAPPPDRPDFYLVLAGPQNKEPSSKGKARPWLINNVFLFNASELLSGLEQPHIKIGVSTSVRKILWEEAEIYPNSRNPIYEITDSQRKLLALFGE